MLMPKRIFLAFSVFVLAQTAVASNPFLPKERTTALDGEWRFAKDGGPFMTVEVPHDWGIAGPFKKDGDGNTGKLPWKGTGVYRRSFTCRKPVGGGAARLEFDGVMARPEVFVNGVRVGGWDYGYMSFWCDITAAVKDGENALEVRADTRCHGSRWYPGGGIYRSVRLVECAPGYTLPGSVFITTPEVSEKSATVHVEWETRTGRHEKTFKVENPVLWSPETPHLYTVDVNGTKYRYGIRTCEWTADDGFHLNGKRYQIKGANLHADFGPLGIAFHKGAARRQLEIMRSMGVNAIRTAHNPQAPEFLDLCDEMGFLVWDECFDKWNDTASRRKDENLEEYVSRNLAAFVRRDRNHPCVVCWSISNEIRAATDAYPDGQTKERVAAFAAVVRSVDPTRPVGSGNCKPEGFPDKSIFEALDVTGWNYARAYAAQHAFDPAGEAVVMTESACNCSSRDWYGDAPPANKLDFDFKANEVSAYDSCAAQFGDIPDVEFLRVERDRYCAGEFVWCGFDYLGEPYPFEPGMNKVPSPKQSRSSYFGCVDLTGVPKNEYYLYRSQWNDKAHTVRIVAPSSPALRAAYVYTDGDSAELFADGRSLGMKRKLKDIDYPLDFKRDWPKAESCEANPYYAVCDKYRFRWFDVPAVKKELTAVAYKDGKEIGRETLRLPGAPARLEIEEEPERDGLLFFHVKMVDANGTVVPDASDRVAFALSGPGRLLAVGNGNANGYDSFADTFSHPLYRGRALAIVRRTGDGEISLSVWNEERETGNGEKANLVLGVVSDIHISLRRENGADTFDGAETYRKALSWLRDAGVDAVVNCGDIADSGILDELAEEARVWREVFTGDAPERLFVFGNHDVDGFNRRAEKIFGEDAAAHLIRRNLDSAWQIVAGAKYAPVWHKRIRGYDFVGANWGKENECDEWLTQNAASFLPARPFFYIRHPHVPGTCMADCVNPRTLPTDASETALLSAFANAVVLSGHSHASLTDERSVWRGAFSAVNAGSLKYTGPWYKDVAPFGRENDNPPGPFNTEDPYKIMRRIDTSDGHQAMIARVYDDRIVFERMDVGSMRHLGDDWEVPLAPGVRYVPPASAFAAPEFPDGAELSVKMGRGKNRGGKGVPSVEQDILVIAIPAANAVSGARALDYRIRLTDESGACDERTVFAKSFYRAADGSHENAETVCRLPVGRLKVRGNVRVEVVPRNSLGIVGRQLKGDMICLK